MPPVPIWPTADGFPQGPQVGKWNFQRESNLSKFKVSVGPPKVRRRANVSVIMADASFMLTRSQMLALLSFFENDCCEGAVPFQWTNPDTLATEFWSWREPPVMSNVNDNAYSAQCSLRRDY